MGDNIKIYIKGLQCKNIDFDVGWCPEAGFSKHGNS
jgi:hypothetical protein